MKKTFLSFLLCCLFAAPALSQVNLQVHYDFGRDFYKSLPDRSRVTTTVEMFKPDKFGSTFFFIDMDYGEDGITSSYWEISRQLRFWKAPVSIHVEYDGGLNFINHSFLGGAAYNWNSKDFSKVFGIQLLYKYIHKNVSPHNFQITATWTLNFYGGRYTFCGFMDLWREKHTDLNGRNHSFIFLGEPQFWINLDKFEKVSDDLHLSIGTEWEMSTNFALRDGFYFIPTLALKWTF